MKPVQTPKQCQRDGEANHEQEQERMKGHQNPRCLKLGAERAPVSGRIRKVESDCQAIGREVRIIHHRQSLDRIPTGNELTLCSLLGLHGVKWLCLFCGQQEVLRTHGTIPIVRTQPFGQKVR